MCFNLQSQITNTNLKSERVITDCATIGKKTLELVKVKYALWTLRVLCGVCLHVNIGGCLRNTAYIQWSNFK